MLSAGSTGPHFYQLLAFVETSTILFHPNAAQWQEQVAIQNLGNSTTPKRIAETHYPYIYQFWGVHGEKSKKTVQQFVHDILQSNEAKVLVNNVDIKPRQILFMVLG